MSRRPTIADLARAAGVSIATVDRVINRRHPVREDTAGRVLGAAEAIGFHATSLLKQRLNPDIPARTFGFVLQKRTDGFYQTLAAALDAAARSATGVRGQAIVEFAADLTPASMTEKLAVVGARADAVGIVAIDHPSVTGQIDALREQGVPVFSLLTGLSAPSRAGYIGIDNRKAGRTAAWGIARTARRAGEVALVVGSHRYLGHELREIGFRSYFREHAPEFRVLDTLMNLEERRLTHEATLNLLAKHPDLAGICVAGGGMEGVIDALREEGRAGTLSVVVNELTPDARSALVDDVVTFVIGTPVPLLAQKTIEAMVQKLDGGASEGVGEILLTFDLFIAESI